VRGSNKGFTAWPEVWTLWVAAGIAFCI